MVIFPEEIVAGEGRAVGGRQFFLVRVGLQSVREGRGNFQRQRSQMKERCIQKVGGIY
jgi:hypothetical protein